MPVLFGKMHLDSGATKYFTVPSSEDIDQDEYNKLARNVCNGDCLDACDDAVLYIHFVLTKVIGTPTAIRLWSDIEQMREDYKKFASQMKRYKPDRD